jgi:hypothetical protein
MRTTGFDPISRFVRMIMGVRFGGKSGRQVAITARRL